MKKLIPFAFVLIACIAKAQTPENPEKAKEEALLDFKSKINKYAQSIGYKAMIGFSDDDLKNVKHIEDLIDIANEIDDYKSNLFVRFLSSPQLFEFDTEDKKAQSIFQLYGQSFDKVKKYIDNIAYMRNVSYDGVNNLPDILLKNFSVFSDFSEKKNYLCYS
jgi:hypothetical protein